MKHLLSISDLSKEEILSILELAEKLKFERQKRIFKEYLRNKSLAMIFELPSTRTRISFEIAMLELGGHALYLSWNDLQLGRGEPIKDTARVMSRYVNAVMMRVRNHSTIEEFARFSSVPVINGLSNLEHPCQILADLLTIKEKKGRLDGIKIAWIGDGNNVCNSLILAAAKLGIRIDVACPEGYEPDSDIIKFAHSVGVFKLLRNPKEAVMNADIIYTDVWASMGQEAEREKRLKAFKDYQVNENLLRIARDAIVMHCLPAHRGEEITDTVIEGKNSVIFDQAENRLHAQKALLINLII
ncbi:MAG: ornithine carbamoyltransferase [Archaeoglobaceae archaeon]|nr:ornithine carbamoyltransferase [Archaeoglobaceae archaeon]MDW7989667.1 ornithine carbamoyltransferase [Archaeoglobaceae archaeon]